MSSRETSVHIAGMKGPVRDVVKKARWPEKFGPAIAHFSIEDALASTGLWRPEEYGSLQAEDSGR